VSFTPLPPSAEDDAPREPIVIRELSLQERAVRLPHRSLYMLFTLVAARVGNGSKRRLRLLLQAF